MENKLRLILLAAIFSFITIGFANESGPVDQRQIEWFGKSTLKGAREIYPQVALEIVEKEETKSGFTPQIGTLTQKNLQQQLEKMLKESGIRITNKFDAKSETAPLSLNVTIFAKVRDDTVLPSFGIFVYTEALQPEIIIRDSKIRTFSRTWPMVPMGDATRALLFCTAETIEDEITKEVTRQVTNFIIDYGNANPSRRITVPQPDSDELETEPENPEQGTI